MKLRTLFHTHGSTLKSGDAGRGLLLHYSEGEEIYPKKCQIDKKTERNMGRKKKER